MTGRISEDPDKPSLDGTEKLAMSAGGSNYGSVLSTIAAWLASASQTLTGKTISASSNTISGLMTSNFAAGVLDTDGTLAADSDTRIASQKAVKTYADALIAANNAMVFKGSIDCSTSPNYPAANLGWTYRASVAGKIGGASGINVEVNDEFICLVNGTASGNQATVGSSWTVIQANIDGAVTGPASSTAGNIATFNGTSGKVVSDGGALISTDGTMAANSNAKVPTEAAVRSYVASLGTFAPALIRSYLAGLTLSTPGSSANFTVATGAAVDGSGGNVMQLLSSLQKNTAAWTVGVGNGALDTGSIAANTWYHVYLIERLDTHVVDVLISLSSTTPTLPANYTISRRIGALLTDASSHWTLFHQRGDEFLWDVRVNNKNLEASSTTSQLATATVPTGVQVLARITARVDAPSASTGSCLVTSPDESDQALSISAQTLLVAAGSAGGATFDVRTNTSGQIRYKSSSTGGFFTMNTYGWIDRRGRDD